MKTFKEILSETQLRNSEGEKNFYYLHSPVNYKNLVPGVTDQDHVFNGLIQRDDPRTSSYHGTQDIDAYDRGMKIDPNLGKNTKGIAAMAQSDLGEKTLTPAEMKKREEVAMAIKRENPKMPMAKKMAIATATAKRVAENYDEEMDYEGEMARTELAAICDKSEKLMGMMDDDTQLEAWLQSKITKAKYMIDSVYDYLTYKRKPAPTEMSPMGASYGSFLNRMGESVDLEEARRGRPRKDGSKPEGDEEGGREHIVMQLRKSISLRGDKDVEFNDNSKHKISAEHAKKALSMHDNMKRAEEKQAFAARLAKSHSSFKDAVSGKPAEKAKPKISLGGKMTEAKSSMVNFQDINPEGGAGVNTLSSDRGAVKTYTTIGSDGRVKLVKHREHRKEINVESKDMNPKNGEKMIKHDCAKHVLHKEWGEGETVEGQHTIVETSEHEGYVTHYDVMFAHGIERDVPVQDLKIVTMVEHWHKGYKPKSMREQTVPKTAKQKKLAALGHPKDKITHKDVLIGRGVIAKEAEEFTSAAVSKALSSQTNRPEQDKENMQQASIDKLSTDPLALKKKITLPPTQGNKSIGGEGTAERGGGKISVEEEKLAKLYDSLSESNKTKFVVMLETDEGLAQLLKFAEEQGF